MATIDDLGKKSISEMTDAELQQTIFELRNARRAEARSRMGKKKKALPAAKPPTLSPSEREEVMKTYLMLKEQFDKEKAEKGLP